MQATKYLNLNLHTNMYMRRFKYLVLTLLWNTQEAFCNILKNIIYNTKVTPYVHIDSNKVVPRLFNISFSIVVVSKSTRANIRVHCALLQTMTLFIERL